MAMAGKVPEAWQDGGESRTWCADAPGWPKRRKKCDGKVEQAQDFVGIIGRLFVGNLSWSIGLEGQHRAVSKCAGSAAAAVVEVGEACGASCWETGKKWDLRSSSQLDKAAQLSTGHRFLWLSLQCLPADYTLHQVKIYNSCKNKYSGFPQQILWAIQLGISLFFH